MIEEMMDLTHTHSGDASAQMTCDSWAHCHVSTPRNRIKEMRE